MTRDIAPHIYGSACAFLLMVVFLSTLLDLRKRRPVSRIASIAVLSFVILFPFGSLPVSGYLFGIFGELSVVAVIFLICALGRQLLDMKMLPEGDRRALLCVVGAAGLFLYPAATGFWMTDIYRLGYQPVALVFIAAAVAMGMWLLGRRVAALFLLISMAAFNLRILESDNLWDYITDPLVTLWAWGWLILGFVRRRR